MNRRPQAVLYEYPQWTRQQVKGDSRRVYLFGDNSKDRTETHHVPKFTQAVIRGLPNAFGIDTKHNRGTLPESYLSDSDYDWFVAHVDSQIDKVLKTGKLIVISRDGIGTGKAFLKEKAPKCYDYLRRKLNMLLTIEKF